MSIQTTRRDVLKATAAAVITLAVPISAQATEKRRWAMYIDVSKCYGCYACMVACAPRITCL
ncbi:hypothetical protein CGL51_14480 [Pyrobaculum aerophilum]|uniref:4Fe-4S ferredoxin-type domain-containing protein n=1 Tax=Pyrobaculum aerophilum TaxID=13773 RepID=A0A371QU23_9CREN|nr:twin-arginine translocation signal domain-containing protein [Pyrobaculum aerophilum]RFA92355.1 hypothetical protein CGL51_14480 [Pyrobaculum aerophilum]